MYVAGICLNNFCTVLLLDVMYSMDAREPGHLNSAPWAALSVLTLWCKARCGIRTPWLSSLGVEDLWGWGGGWGWWRGGMTIIQSEVQYIHALTSHFLSRSISSLDSVPHILFERGQRVMRS